MARQRNRTKAVGAKKGMSVAKWYGLAVLCFLVSAYFESRVPALDHTFALIGSGLFLLAARAYWISRKSKR